MNKQIILRVDTSPAILSRQHNSFALSVMGACVREYLPWIHSNFIHTVHSKSAMWQYDFCIANPWLPKSGLTDCNNLTFHSSTADFNSFDRVGIIRTMLSQGYYIRGDFNTAYVKMKKSYSSSSQNAEYLIYGYDDDAEIFYAVGRNADALFGKYILTYGEYEDAVRNRADKKFNLNFVKIKDDFIPPHSSDAILNSLAAYLNSDIIETEKTKDKIYGLACFVKFSSYVRKMSEVYDNIDIRYAMFYAEHKNILKSTIDYLAYMLPEKVIVGSFDGICADAERVYHFLESYNMTHDYKYALNADELIRDITQREGCEIRRVLECMGQ